MKPVMSFVTISVIVTCVACGAARRREPIAEPQLDAKARQGRVAFGKFCHQCHPGGEAGLGPALNDKPFPEFLKKFQVRHGLGAMPGFSEKEISDADLDAIMEYLSALRRTPARPRAGAPDQ